ncbi:hypothetical protein COW36_17350 [bacterium (Candidatus Blackallbacteria) CG17_big_fil_post_rev_8_21_14_2_50_48_46]|uniref:Fatty acid hydroxylase domain-containing protein n=1 Tax=bacterium (Candidatus Blackallbacteria) CG17_big_fil_post_rev_8_21_14_2_50_48_46 TaxID=2014261 RepID=A0A2M7G0E1_9BACT|nr:MAG: hypothetical protein COW64_01380 [bacterium (Candidatus Blackallbacteria) CG18_big_fil_WC_8_21_14_2_50_49_26]PIW15188.1 MAG: hypothetical protein COW36_17350 [bacterium (Candidatus Blackallbacteria) CG17_big_fil_post_rev_8_21_14_2_50_48_46]PIW44775.1 MAG: hypothetical protein COW20_22685 [bacterium (Candidatus Blackallbacteria) CG13_big_fil_rev_8_21_14_2_50_49_14]
MNLESLIRLGSFVGVFAFMTLWELWKPCRQGLLFQRRWWSNLGLVVFNTLLLRFSLGALAYQTAVFTQAQGWGVLNLVNAPVTLELLFSVAVLDLAIYLQHVLFHALPLFWRLHRVHHADSGFDATTGLRFHPLEILLSMLYKTVLVLALGPSPGAVLLFELLLNASAVFNHGNIRLPGGLEKILRLLIVTPDFHRVHHSQAEDETNSNYGFFLSCWDHLGGTYRAEPRQGHAEMQIGLANFQGAECDRLPEMLLLPLRSLKKD